MCRRGGGEADEAASVPSAERDLTVCAFVCEGPHRSDSR